MEIGLDIQYQARSFVRGRFSCGSSLRLEAAKWQPHCTVKSRLSTGAIEFARAAGLDITGATSVCRPVPTRYLFGRASH